MGPRQKLGRHETRTLPDLTQSSQRLSHERHSYVSVERRAECGEHRGIKNSKIDTPNLGMFKNRPEYTRNILDSAKNSKKCVPISVGGKAPNLKWSH